MLWGNIASITRPTVISPHRHRMFELVVCLGDVGTHMVAGIDYPFRHGRTFAIPGNVPHQVLCQNNRPADIAFVCFDMHTDIDHFSPAVAKIIREICEHSYYAAPPTGRLDENVALVRSIFDELTESSLTGQISAGVLLSKIIVNHRASFFSRALHGQLEDTSRISVVRSWIAANFANEITVDSAARKAGMSRSLFTRVFRKHVGMSLVEYLVSLRISDAIRHLVQSSRPVEQIAEECGFRNLGYFYRTFKKHTNTTPRKLRAFAKESGGVPLV
ncbi:MAG: helix-turn-helix transcriptional regulator [Victivallales bacterium]|nr:helix-turn-helix transcriptional regulator [Victivallales bacterium]